MSKNLVYIEHAHGKMQKASAVALAAANKVGGDCVALVLGQGVDAVAAEAGKLGVSKVVVIDEIGRASCRERV